MPEDARPLSVVFSGSFARGESGHYEYRNRRVPSGAYHLEAIVPRPLLDSEREPIDREIVRRLGFQPAAWDSGPTSVEDAEIHNVLDFRFQTEEEFLSRPPDLALWDFLASYRVLWGENPVTGNLEISLDEISPFSPLVVLSDRAILGLKHCSAEYWEKDPTEEEALAFRLAMCRLYLDMAGAISFFYGDYRTGFADRAAFLRECHGLWKGWFPDPEPFISQVEDARRFVAEPRLERAEGSKILDEWFRTVTDLGRILPHVVNLALLTKRVPLPSLADVLRQPMDSGKRPGTIESPFEQDWRLLVARQIRMYPNLFFRDFLFHALRRKGRKLPWMKSLSSLASRYYGVFEHYLWRGRKWLARNPRRATLSPPAFQLAVLPLILFSLSPEREVSLKHLEMFDRLMKPYMLMPFEFLPPLKRWEATKRCFVHEMLDYRK